MFRPGLRVAVAASGGPDSLCLLHALHEMSAEWGISLAVAHCNHKLRGADSETDEQFVAQVAQGLGLRFYTTTADVRASGGNLEQTARRARRAFFAQLIREGHVDRVALGHTRDDQAETVLFRLLRGAGLTGLAGVLPVTEEGLVRPLIEVTRAEVTEFLQDRSFSWREDASNRDPRFARNRIRHELLPQLQREWNPRLRESLAHLADLAYEEERWWRGEVERLAPAIFVRRQRGMEANVASLTTLPRATARRLLRWALGEVRGDLRGVEFRHVEAVLELAERSRGEGSIRLPGAKVQRSFDWILLAEPSDRPVLPAVAVEFPGIYPTLSGTEIHFALAAGKRRTPCDTLKAAELCVPRLPVACELRGWRPGDHYRPLGHARDVKLSELFQRDRVPSWQRPIWPMVTCGAQILWARRFGAAAEFAADAGPRLRIWESAVDDKAVESFSRDSSS